MDSSTVSSHTSVIKLSRFRADVSRALGRRGKAILEAEDVPQQVAALTPLEAYFIVKELGVEDALPILMNTSHDQLQMCVDLDCWEGDNFSPDELDAWLAAFSNDSPDALASAFFLLDEELQTLFIAASLDIYDVRSDWIPDTDNDTPRLETICGFFVLIGKETRDRELEPFTLITALYKYDMQEAIRLLMSAKWELVSSTEEDAWQFRVGRLADWGFPTVAEAAALFAPPPATPPQLTMVDVGRAAEPIAMPALYAWPLTDTSLLCRALGTVVDQPTLLRLETELVQLINAAVVAYGDSPRDLQHVVGVATRVRDTLSLGLDVALAHNGLTDLESPEAEAAAAQLLSTWPLRHLFQRGYRAVVPLHQAARTLARDPVVAAWLDVNLSADDDPERLDRCFLRALVRPRPLCSGEDTLHAERTRAWHSQADVAASQARLETLSARLL